MPGARTALEGRVITHHRIAAVQLGVQMRKTPTGRIADMDLEGRDIDFIFPGTWAASLTALDVTLAEGLYRAYHRYMHDYTAKYPDRLKSAVAGPWRQTWPGPCKEIKTLAQEKWLAAVWVHLPEGKPIDHPDFEPLWATMNDLGPASHPSQLLRGTAVFPRVSRHLGKCCRGQDGRAPLGSGTLLRLFDCLGAL